MKKLIDYFSLLPVKRFARGEIIYFQDEKPECAYGIKTGIVKLYSLTPEGEEKCISYEVDGSIIPICWLFSKTDRTLFYYQAHVDCELVVINKDEFHRVLYKDPLLTYDMLTEQLTYYVQLMLQVNSLEQPRASVKLLNMFQFLCLRYGHDVKENVVKINLPLTQQDIAGFTGLTRETTTVELKRFKQQRIISCSQKIYTVFTDKLHKTLADGFNSGVHITHKL